MHSTLSWQRKAGHGRAGQGWGQCRPGHVIRQISGGQTRSGKGKQCRACQARAWQGRALYCHTALQCTALHIMVSLYLLPHCTNFPARFRPAGGAAERCRRFRFKFRPSRSCQQGALLHRAIIAHCSAVQCTAAECQGCSGGQYSRQ
jgi:hypothetical protein